MENNVNGVMKIKGNPRVLFRTSACGHDFLRFGKKWIKNYREREREFLLVVAVALDVVVVGGGGGGGGGICVFVSCPCCCI